MPPPRLLAAAALALPTTLSLGTAERLEAAAHDTGRWLGSGVAALFAVPEEDPAAAEPDVVSGADLVIPPSELSAPPRSGKRGRRAHAAVKAGHTIRVSAAAVLHLARVGVVPVGRTVPAQGARPAGIEVSSVTGLGTGVRDGDVLTEVLGVPVTDAGQVVAIVLAVRSRRDRAISATFYRGTEPWGLVVEMPYP